MSFGGDNGAARAAKAAQAQQEAQLKKLQAQQAVKEKTLQEEEIGRIRRAGGGFGGEPTAPTGEALGGGQTALGGVPLTRFTGS